MSLLLDQPQQWRLQQLWDAWVGKLLVKTSLLRSILLQWHRIWLTQFHSGNIGSICIEKFSSLRMADLQCNLALTQMAPAVRFRKTSYGLYCSNGWSLLNHIALVEAFRWSSINFSFMMTVYILKSGIDNWYSLLLKQNFNGNIIN